MQRTNLVVVLTLTLLGGTFAACGSTTDTVGRQSAGGAGGGGIQIGPGVDCALGPNFTDCPCSAGETKACYTGAAATRGVGACQDGVQTCEQKQELHFSFGPCVGETLPAPAQCDGLDHACTGSSSCGDGATSTGTGGGPPVGDDQHVVQVVNVGNTLCAVTTAGHVACGGQYAPDPKLAALQWVPGLSNAIAVSGNTGPCVLQSTGTVMCWGQNEGGQTGDGTTVTPRLAPVQVKGLTDAVEIASGTWHTCARRASGEVVCWGQNCIGQLGDGNGHDPMFSDAMCPLGSMPTPDYVKVVGITDAVQITATAYFTCARLKGGGVKCWGGPGQVVGDGSSGLAIHPGKPDAWLVHPSPVDVSGLSDAIDVSSGNNSTFAVRANGTVTHWGGAFADIPSAIVPAVIPGLTGVSTVRAGQSALCALRTTGEVACWGMNNAGELGNGMILPFGDFSETNLPGSPVLGISGAIRLDMNNTDAVGVVDSTHIGYHWGHENLAPGKLLATPTAIVLPP